MESIMSQIFLIGPSYCLMKSRGGEEIKYTTSFSCFQIKTK